MVHLPGKEVIGLAKSIPLNILLAAPGWTRCSLDRKDEGAIHRDAGTEARHTVATHALILPAGRLAMLQGFGANPFIDRLYRVIIGAAPRGIVAAVSPRCAVFFSAPAVPWCDALRYRSVVR